MDEITTLIRQAVSLSQEQGVSYTIVRRDDGLLLIPLALLDPTTDYLIEIIRPTKKAAS